MSGYLTYLMVEAQQAEVEERARRYVPAHDMSAHRRRHGRLRVWTARLLVALAFRLDHGLHQTPVTLER